MSVPVPPPWRAEISSIFGSISFACYLILMVPQLVEQWRLKTVDGVSLYFLGIWMLGDITNLIGAVWAGLLPEVIMIAIWFLIADVITVAFYFYIKIFFDNQRKERHHINIHIEQEQSYGSVVVNNNNNNNSHPIDEVNRRKSHSSTLEGIIYEPENHSILVKYVLPILLVLLAGVFGSILSPNKTNSILSFDENHNNKTATVAQIFGYISAFLYLIARLPQIYQNYQKKSTDGLSLLFFMLTMLGNITFTLQIITFRSDLNYLILNLSWLLGSAGTIIQDLIIIFQFYKYRNNHSGIINDNII